MAPAAPETSQRKFLANHGSKRSRLPTLLHKLRKAHDPLFDPSKTGSHCGVFGRLVRIDNRPRQKGMKSGTRNAGYAAPSRKTTCGPKTFEIYAIQRIDLFQTPAKLQPTPFELKSNQTSEWKTFIIAPKIQRFSNHTQISNQVQRPKGRTQFLKEKSKA